MIPNAKTCAGGQGAEPRKIAIGPRGHWLLGCMPEIWKRPLEFYSGAWREYGDIVRIRAVPGMDCYLLTHPDAVEHVLLKNHKNYRKPAMFNQAMSLLVGQGLFSSEGELWLRQRRLAQPAFHRLRLAALFPIMADAVNTFVQEREAAGPDQEVELLDEMMRLSLRIACATLFGADIPADTETIRKAYSAAFDYLSYRIGSLVTAPLWFPSPRNRAFQRDKRFLDRVVLDLIETRRKTGAQTSDLLSLLLAAQDEETGVGMSDQQLKDEALTVLTAGHETTGTALAWAWYLLGTHPQVQQDVYDEVSCQLQGRAPAVEDLPDLPLTRAVFEETLRLYPPAYGQPREAIGEDVIQGVRIPAKAIVALTQYVTHRRPDFWEQPDAFKPERFLPANSQGRHRFAYFPFGGGPRACIGANFALMEGPLIIASVLQKFQVELVPNHPVEPATPFTLRPKYGVKARLISRSSNSAIY